MNAEADSTKAETKIKNFFIINSILGLLLFIGIFKDISWLALQSPADRLQRGKPDSLGLPRLQDGKVGRSDPNLLGKRGGRHLSLRQHDINIDYYRHIIQFSTQQTYIKIFVIPNIILDFR